MPLRRLRRSKPIEICLNFETEEYVYLHEITQKFNAILANHEKQLESDPEAQISE